MSSPKLPDPLDPLLGAGAKALGWLDHKPPGPAAPYRPPSPPRPPAPSDGPGLLGLFLFFLLMAVVVALAL